MQMQKVRNCTIYLRAYLLIRASAGFNVKPHSEAIAAKSSTSWSKGPNQSHFSTSRRCRWGFDEGRVMDHKTCVEEWRTSGDILFLEDLSWLCVSFHYNHSHTLTQLSFTARFSLIRGTLPYSAFQPRSWTTRSSEILEICIHILQLMWLARNHLAYSLPEHAQMRHVDLGEGSGYGECGVKVSGQDEGFHTVSKQQIILCDSGINPKLKIVKLLMCFPCCFVVLEPNKRRGNGSMRSPDWCNWKLQVYHEPLSDACVQH